MFEQCKIARQHADLFEELLDKYKFDADEQLLAKIAEIRNTIAISRG
jgi:hypothetical protein